MRILLVEDDPLLGDGIRAGLVQEGYAVDWVSDGQAASTALTVEPFDLMVLDLGLPRRSGLEVLAELRNRKDALPVLILTARDTVADRIHGLDTGADDYLVKPFDLDELFARIRALLRRGSGRGTPTLHRDGLTMDPAAHTVVLAGEPVDLSRGEFSVLQLLLENQGKVLSRERLEQSLYGWNKIVDSNTVEVHISHLRKKLGSSLIRTVRGIGYVIDKETE